MFEPDEFLFSKVARFFKNRRTRRITRLKHRATLESQIQRLTIFARAVTGEAIDIFPAEEEGGYKDDCFFLPEAYDFGRDLEENKQFYIFRTLFLSVQKNLDLNWKDGQSHDLQESRKMAKDHAKKVMRKLFAQFPFAEAQLELLSHHFNEGESGYGRKHFLYGKWMTDSGEENQSREMNIDSELKQTGPDEITTQRKARAVEEIQSVEVDKKQQEDAVLQHQFEKVETADEFGGNWKDFDGDDELDDHSNALDELSMNFTVRVDDPVHSVYQADFIENTTVSESAEIDDTGYHIVYDEWNYKARSYKERFCKVYPKSILKTDHSYYHKAMSENNAVLVGLRKMLTSINNKYMQRRRQPQGEEFDIDALTDLYVSINSGHTPSDKIYMSRQRKEKDLSILLLLDISLSSDSYAAGNKVIDVEKQVSILFGEILNEFHIDFSIDCFYSKTRNHTSYITIKDFDESWERAKFKVGAVEPGGYTRIGAALRHSGAMLDKRDSKSKWVILISDGKPNDYDKYEGRYGINDVKQALRELDERGIQSYALAIEAQAKYYLPQMFGQNHYQILTTPVELLTSLVKLYEKIKHQ